MGWIYALSAFACGLVLATQPVINARVAALAGSALTSAVISVSVTFLFLLLSAILMRAPLPGPRLLGSLPPWLYTGGLVGAQFLVISLVVAPRLGVATTVGLLVTGQLVMAVTIDHFGWFGVPVQPVSPLRLAGAGCLLLGLVLIRW